MKHRWNTKLPVEVTSTQVPLTAYSWKFATWHTWQHQLRYPVEYHKSETQKERSACGNGISTESIGLL